MGLAPYGKKGVYKALLYKTEHKRVMVDEKAIKKYFTKPANKFTRHFNKHFQYYADIARWVQDETERAILYIFKQRVAMHPHANLCYAGGVALNAVCNTKIIQQPDVTNFYAEPAAGDNGLALGCAFYGWIQVLQKEKVRHSGTTLLGKHYAEDEIEDAINTMMESEAGKKIIYKRHDNFIAATVELLIQQKRVAWFQLGFSLVPNLGHVRWDEEVFLPTHESIILKTL